MGYMVEMTETGTITSRAFGHCTVRGCRIRRVLEVQGASRYAAFDRMRREYAAYTCPEHGSAKWVVDMTRVTLSPQTPCRETCTDAMTPNCKCSCGGAHHGERVADHDKWSGS